MTTLEIEYSDRIVEVTLVGRGDRNLLTWDLLKDLKAFADEMQQKPEIRVVIFKGKPSVFTGGFDLKTAIDAMRSAESLAALRLLNSTGAELCNALERMRAFTICAIDGYCVGGGAAIAISCDMRVASEDATMFIPEILRAMNLGWGAIARLVNLVGPARAKEACILAEKVDAATALRLGMIERVAGKGQAVDAARELAREIATRPPVVVQMIKRSVNAYAGALTDVATYADGDQFLLLTSSSEDTQEGIDSFFERRPPVFMGA